MWWGEVGICVASKERIRTAWNNADGIEGRYSGGNVVGRKEISETKRRGSWENEESLVGTERVNR